MFDWYALYPNLGTAPVELSQFRESGKSTSENVKIVRVVAILHPFQNCLEDLVRKAVRRNTHVLCAHSINHSMLSTEPRTWDKKSLSCGLVPGPAVLETARGDWPGRLNVRASFMSGGLSTPSVTSLFHVYSHCCVRAQSGSLTDFGNCTRTYTFLGVLRTVLWTLPRAARLAEGSLDKGCHAIVLCLLHMCCCCVSGTGGSTACQPVSQCCQLPSAQGCQGFLSRFPHCAVDHGLA